MKQVTDYYDVLGVDAHAPNEVIKKAFKHLAGSSVLTKTTTDESPAAHHERQRSYAFPVLNEDAPAQIDLGELTYLLSAREVRRLKEQGMLRGAKDPSRAGTYYCHR